MSSSTTFRSRSLDFPLTDTFDCFLAVEFSVEVPRENEVLPQVFKPAFECPLEDFRLRKATGFSDFSNLVGGLGGHTERSLDSVLKSVSACSVGIRPGPILLLKLAASALIGLVVAGCRVRLGAVVRHRPLVGSRAVE
ncbi:hypothetical protein R3751_04610 [Halorubrum distributum]|uniref:hypothetical protein n=1 Tax=Halorubrum distributum TaxID=29283 RepID=UPI002952B27F|nr:hypothetical protein [Halorubrum distributum]MDV7349060.1 hypothetical protein [Halorubrum distributum]